MGERVEATEEMVEAFEREFYGELPQDAVRPLIASISAALSAAPSDFLRRLADEKDGYPRNHAPWCRWTHKGPCPAENDPPPDLPVEALARLPAEMIVAAAPMVELAARAPYESSQYDARRILHAALAAAPTDFLARLLVERLGGEEELAEQLMLRAVVPHPDGDDSLNVHQVRAVLTVLCAPSQEGGAGG